MANEAAGSCVVVLGGKRYNRFSSLTLKRSVEEGTCSGTIVLSWPGADQFNTSGFVASDFVDGADGQIFLDGQLAGTITLDSRSSKGSPKSYELTLQFRGQCSEYVDGSPDHDTGQENKKSPAEIMKTLMKGGKGQLIDQSGFTRPIERFIIAEGESIERACRRVAREMGLLFWENPEGNWVLQSLKQPAGGTKGELRLGKQFTHWSTKADMGPRFNVYGAAASGIATDTKRGKINESMFSQQFRQIKSKRQLRLLIDGDHDPDSLRDRVQFEGNRRVGQGLNVTLRMSTWSDESGKIWGASDKWHVVIPIDRVDDDMKLSEVEFELTSDSRIATLVFMSENVFGAGDESVYNDNVEHLPIVPTVEAPQTPAPTPPAGN